jgi:hypothetical protein
MKQRHFTTRARASSALCHEKASSQTRLLIRALAVTYLDRVCIYVAGAGMQAAPEDRSRSRWSLKGFA